MKKRLSELAPILVCAMLCAALSSMLFKKLDIDMPAGFALLWSAVFIMALYVILINKRLAAVIFTAFSIAAVVVFLRLSDETRDVLSDFVNSAYRFIFISGELGDAYVKPLSMIIVFAVSFVMIFPAVVFPFFPAVLAISIISMVALWEYQSTDMINEAAAVMGALTVLFAGSMKIHTSDKAKTIRNIVTAWLVPFAALIMAAVVAISQSRDMDAKWEWLEVRTNIIGDYISDISGENSPRTIYNIAASGYQPLGTRLGGSVTLGDDEVMQIAADRSGIILLRGSIKNTYTGSSWTDSETSYRSRISSKYEKELAEALNLDIPPEESKSAQYFSQIIINIIPTRDGSSTVFTPIRTIDVTADKVLTMLIYFNGEGEIFSSRDILKGTSYTIEAEYLNYESESFSDYVDEIQSQMTQEEKEAALLSVESYTEEFDAATNEVTALAIELTEGLDSDYEKALAIKEYLEDNFTYTLSPGTPPEDEDFVSYFLDTKEGYCTYFASAMAALARSAGLPSRYVEGYKAEIEDAGEYSSVTERDAHAWAEIYILGIGWLPFDPVISSQTTTTAISTDKREDDEELVPEVTAAPEVQEEDVSPESEKSSSVFVVALIFAATVLIAISLFTAAKLRTHISFIRRRVKSANGIIIFCYTEIMAILCYLNYEKPDGTTLKKYAEGVDKLIILDMFNFHEVAETVSRVVYGENVLEHDKGAYVYGYYRRLIRYAKKRFGLLRYVKILIALQFKSLLQKSAPPSL